jgi:hypothetical protein
VVDFTTKVARSDRFTTAAEFPTAQADGEHPEDRDFVIDIGEEWVANAEVGKVWQPAVVPDRDGGFGSAFRHSLSAFCRRSAEITVESTSGRGCSICQGFFCGARVVNKERS